MLAEDVSRRTMLETSQDILYLVISFCIIWITVFLCWTFYYLVKILKNANQIVEEFRVRIQALTEAVDYVRHKVEGISELMSLAGSGVSGFVKKYAEKKAKGWIDTGTDKFNESAKEAVDKAMAATSKKMKKMAKAMKK